ncbi:MAG: guanylate kinase [Clostridiales bacterium]|nr:guanylate kinase [Clostridiales bacterium]
MNNKSLLIVLSGPSGVGKGTVCKKLLSENPNIKLSVSATTRKPRSEDIDGVTYYFKTEDEFKKMIDNDEFMEWAVYNSKYYGTPKKPVYDCLEHGNDVILEIDVQGALNLKNKYPDAVYIFIAPENTEVLYDRLRNRGTESEEEIERRVKAAQWELGQKDKYDHIVINKVVEDAADDIINIINTRRNAL